MALRHSPKIVTDGLLRCLDIGNNKSYPGSGSTITDLSKTKDNGTNNGASYNSDDPKNFSFGNDDYISGTSFIIVVMQDLLRYGFSTIKALTLSLGCFILKETIMASGIKKKCI